MLTFFYGALDLFKPLFVHKATFYIFTPWAQVKAFRKSASGGLKRVFLPSKLVYKVEKPLVVVQPLL